MQKMYRNSDSIWLNGVMPTMTVIQTQKRDTMSMKRTVRVANNHGKDTRFFMTDTVHPL